MISIAEALVVTSKNKAMLLKKKLPPEPKKKNIITWQNF